jgi:hypothetical protein
MAPIKDAMLGGVSNLVGVVKPLASIFVVMKTFSISTTSLLDHAFFFKITFQLGFFKSLEEEYLCHLKGKYKRFNHKWQPMSKIHYKESIIILYISHISLIVSSVSLGEFFIKN